jgi:hypothetical protein
LCALSSLSTHFSSTMTRVFDDEIDAEAFVEAEPFIRQRNWNLSFHLQTSATKFVRKDCLIHRLQQARPPSPMDLHGHVNDMPA